MDAKFQKDMEFLKSLQSKNEAIFNCSLTQIMTDGFDKCADYDLPKIAERINDNDMFSKDFQLAIFETAREIAKNVTPWNLVGFIKDEVSVYTAKMSYTRLMIIIHNLIYLANENGFAESDIMDYAYIDEEEWAEIFNN